MDRIKLCYISGEDIHLRIPLIKLLQPKFDIVVIGSGPRNEFDQHNIEYHFYDLKRWISPIADMRAQKQLTQLLNQIQPDIVHAFDTKPAILAMYAAQKAGVPIRIRTINGMGYVFSSSSPLALSLRSIYRNMQKKAARSASMTIFQNRDDRAYFQQYILKPNHPTELIKSSGVDIELLKQRLNPDHQKKLYQQFQLDPDRPIILMAARLVKYKGVEDYLKAARWIKIQQADPQFLLVGPLSSEGRQAIPRSMIEHYRDAVHYLGPRQDLPDIMAISDLFVLPTYYREGVPRVLLEAGALGLPLLATDMPGCRDVIKTGWNGRLTPPKKANKLAEAILDMIHLSPEKRKQMGQYARQMIESDFSLSQVASAHIKIYQTMIETIQ